jgi:hypothetical protein
MNGIKFSTDQRLIANEKCAAMIDKMNKHFADWSKRSLSLLGKMQIIKTFGLSQYLYVLAVVDVMPQHWKQIKNLITKFSWIKNYAGNQAPNRIKNNLMYTSTL